MPSVSVIVPVYNTEAYLPECLDSIVSQTHGDIEIVCVNDGSTDGSGAILRQYADRDGRITLIEQENQGLAGARNSGLDVITGDYVLFLDSDDWFEPTMIEEMYRRCVADAADIGVFKIRYVYVDQGTSTEADWSLRMDVLPHHTPFSRDEVVGNIFTVMTPGVCNKMFSRSFIAEHGLRFYPQLRRAEDVPFTYLALALAERITIVDKALMNYRTGLAGSLQATVHERPLMICDALTLAKRDAIEAGVYEQIEQDFVNAALHQCLFTLDSVKTVSAFYVLYDALKTRYFAELGVEGREDGYFSSARDLQQYRMIVELSSNDYLHRRSLLLQERLGQTSARLKLANKRLAKAKSRLARIEGSLSYRTARAITFIPRRLARALARRQGGE